MAETIYDLIVIGSGPAGYNAALHAARRGMKVLVVERRGSHGGVCLHEGCIPSKALLDSSGLYHAMKERAQLHGITTGFVQLDLGVMMKRKDEVVKKLADGIASLLRKDKVVTVFGEASLGPVRSDGCHPVLVKNQDNPVIPKSFPARRVLLATGSEPIPLPGIPFDDELVVSSTGALAFPSVPDQLLIVGAGYIGIEMGTIWNRLGSRVTIVESLPTFLPSMDAAVTSTLLRSLKKQGITLLFSTTVTRIVREGGRALVTLSAQEGEKELSFDRVLVAIGRRPCLTGLDLEKRGISLDERGRVAVDDDYQTSLTGVHAIGDLVRGPMLAHKGIDEAAVFVDRLSGGKRVVEYDLIPGVIYGEPEVAAIGRTEEELKSSGLPYRAFQIPFMASGRARCMGESDGFVKILADRTSGRVLGVHMIGPHVSELIAEAAVLMGYGGTVDDLLQITHPHPTLSESLKEAAST